jgi:hypothetical protein
VADSPHESEGAMKGDAERIERLLRNAPRPAVPSNLLEKLRSEVRLTSQSSAEFMLRPADAKFLHSRSRWTPWGFLKSNPFNLGGLGLVWTIILLCRITLPNADGTEPMAKLNRTSPEMLVALAEENQRLVFATFRSIRPAPEEIKSNVPRPSNEVRIKGKAG